MKKHSIALVLGFALAAGSACMADMAVSTASDLEYALSYAADGDVITVNSGTYIVSRQIDVTAANVTLRAANPRARPVLDAGSACRILKVTGSGFSASGIVFKNGMNMGGNGGAIKVEGQTATATVKFADCDFEGCQAVYGGAIDAVNETYSSFAGRGQYGLVSGCRFTSCVATSSGMWCGGGAINGALWIENSTFDGCRSNDARQGHAAIAVSGYTTITNCVFVNHASSAKGIVGTGRNSQNDTYANGKARLVDCLIANSTFAYREEGFFDSKVLLDRCVISNTLSTVADAIPRLYNSPSSDASEARVTSCLFVDNQCPFAMEAMPPLMNCTFVRNVGGLACGYVTSLKSAITNCVFWGNVAKTDWPFNTKYNGAPGFYWHPSTPLQDLIHIASTVIEGGSANSDVSMVLAADATGVSTTLTAMADSRGPGFKDAANGDWTLQSKSLLVNAGVLCDWMAGASDLAGSPRVFNDVPDLGCFEYYRRAGFSVSFR